MKRRRRHEAYWKGFRDALVIGLPNPGQPQSPDEVRQMAYAEGFKDGKRAEKRLVNVVAAKA